MWFTWTLTLDVLSKDAFFESDADLVSGVVKGIGDSDRLSALAETNWRLSMTDLDIQL